MGTLIGTALALAALGVLIYPFLRRRKQVDAPDLATARLRAERARIYRLIYELEQDRAAGAVAEDDFASNLNELRVAAARVVRQEAELGVRRADDEELELEIETVRASRQRATKGNRT
jgi:hypothetical protein